MQLKSKQYYMNLFGSVTVITALFSYFYHISGMGASGKLSSDLLYMSPASSISFILLASTLLLREKMISSENLKPIFSVISILVMLYGAISVIGYYVKLHIYANYGATTVSGWQPAFSMKTENPAVGVLFLLSGTAMLFLLNERSSSEKNRSSVTGKIASTLSCTIMAICLTYLLSYIYGTEIIDKGMQIPLSLTTIAAFISTGAGITLLLGSSYFPLSLIQTNETKRRLMLYFLPFILILLLMSELISSFFHTFNDIDSALLTAAVDLFFVIMAVTIVDRLSDMIGLRMDQCEDQRQENADSLIESERRYRYLFENMLNGYAYCRMVYDLSGRPEDFIYLDVNRAFEELTGLKDVKGKRVSEAIPGLVDNDREILDIYGRVAKNGNPEQFEMYLISMNMWFLISVYSPEQDHFVAVFDVITERKNTEEALRHSEQKFSTLFSRASIPVALTGFPDHVFMDVNDAWAELFEFKREEMIGKNSSELGINRDSTRRMLTVEQIERREKIRNLEQTLFSRTGKPVTVLTNINVVNINGVEFALSSLQDITGRKQHEEELLKYKQIASSTKDMLSMVDTGFVYRTVNDSYLKAFGKKPDELIGKNITELFGEKIFNEIIRPKIERCMKGEDIRYQDWFEFPVAGRRYMDVAYSPYFGADSSVHGIVVTSRDITEQESLKSQLLQAQKMEYIGRLAGGVAHDYNNALSVIIGFTELSLEDADPDSDLRDNLNEVLTAANKSAEITSQLLAFARQQTIAPVAIEINDIIESLLSMLRRVIGENIDIIWLPGPGAWSIKIDPVQLNQILTNLCLNARDAIEGTGKIVIKTSNTNFDTDYCIEHIDFEPGEYVQLSISDSGKGIPSEKLDKIFEPFFTTKELGKGSGLGLATVYGIVKQNGGFIQVFSEPEKGTDINIYFPRHTIKERAEDRNGRLEIPFSNGETILLVEDEESILKLGRKVLDTLGYKVLIAGNAEDALIITDEHQGNIDLVITDVIMPGMNGNELAIMLKERYPEIRTIFMSGYTANVIAKHGVLEDGVCFMQKPFSRSDLAFKIREALEDAC